MQIPDHLVFHHIGIATKKLENEIEYYKMLDYQLESEIFEDPTQKIRGIFLINNGTRVELLEPTGDDSPINNVLRKGISMYHQAYLCSEIDQTISLMESRRARLVVPPKPAIAFQGRPIAFMILPNLLLIELIQSAGGR